MHCILVGDYNFYTNTEAAYGTLTAAGNGQCIDPLGADNWTGAANAIKHTQSPRDVTGTLIGGGVDDRFDFQISTPDFHDGDGLSIIDGSYRTFGNDGAHYNLAINSGNIRIAETVIARLKNFSSFARPQDLPSDSQTEASSCVAATCAKFFPI